MSGTRTLMATLALAGVIALAGCGSNTPVPSPNASATSAPSTTSSVATAQASVEPTNATPGQTSGAITSPVAGSAERKALLNAAREKLGTKSEFYVYQIYVQGDTALADIESATKDNNGRIVVAFERVSGKWQAIAAVKYGSAPATASNTSAALPSFSLDLINRFDWNMPKPATKSSSGASSSSMSKSLAAATQKWSDAAMSGKGTPYKVTLVKVAQDSKGVWWGHVVVQPTSDANNSYEALDYWAKYSTGDWQGKLQDPEPPAPSTYFPASVISKLGL